MSARGCPGSVKSEMFIDHTDKAALPVGLSYITEQQHDRGAAVEETSTESDTDTEDPNNWKNMWLPMIGFTALPHLGGLYGGYITRKEVKTWYPILQKPAWRPPNAAFPIVWTCLYTGMGYGSYLVWKELGGFTEDAVVPLGLYGLQLALNWAWTPIFFGAHKLKWALIEIVLLTGTVGATMVSWYSISRTATLLMAPYLSWLCLATSLNYCIWRDNSEEKEE